MVNSMSHELSCNQTFMSMNMNKMKKEQKGEQKCGAWLSAEWIHYQQMNNSQRSIL